MRTSGARARRRLTPYLVPAAVACALTYVAVVDPNRPGHYPTCPFLAMTGYYCPGCGSTRMLHALLHGHVAEAFGRNPLAFVTLPVLGYLWVRWTVAARSGRPFRSVLVRPAAVTVFALVVVAFWIVRNLPIGRALAP